MRSDPSSILATLFGSEKARSFALSWPTTPIVGTGAIERIHPELVSGDLSDIERLATVYRGELAAGGRVGRNVTSFQVQANPIDLYRNGLTVQFVNARPSVPALEAWLAQLADELGLGAEMINLAVFASPGEDAGVGPHFDPSDLIIIQVRGTKLLRVAPSGVSSPVAPYHPGFDLSREQVVQLGAMAPPAEPTSSELVELEPGTAVFLPAGYWHWTAHPAESLSLSLGLFCPRAVDVVLARLRAQLLEDPAWRRPLYGAWGNAALQRTVRDELARLLRLLPGEVQRISPGEALREVSDRAAGFRHLDGHARFYRVPSMTFSFEDANGERAGSTTLSVRAQQGYTRTVLELEEAYVAPCRWIAEARGTFTVQDFLEALGDRLTIDVAQEILTVLTNAGAVQPVVNPRVSSS